MSIVEISCLPLHKSGKVTQLKSNQVVLNRKKLIPIKEITLLLEKNKFVIGGNQTFVESVSLFITF
jgi:hypothetical protein